MKRIICILLFLSGCGTHSPRPKEERLLLVGTVKWFSTVETYYCINSTYKCTRLLSNDLTHYTIWGNISYWAQGDTFKLFEITDADNPNVNGYFDNGRYYAFEYRGYRYAYVQTTKANEQPLEIK